MLCLKLAERVANSVDPDETSHFCSVSSESTLFAQTCLAYGKSLLRQTGKIMILSSVITDWLLITMVGLIIDYLFSSD